MSERTITVYALFGLSMVAVSAGDIVAKYWAHTPRAWSFVAAVLLYASCSAAWMPLLRQQGLIVATNLWAVMSILFSVGIAMAYGESLTLQKTIGVALGLLSVAVLSFQKAA